MKESERILKLFRDLYDGHPWIDVTLAEKLRGFTAEEAFAKPFPGCNSAWEITAHLVSWRRNVLQRVQGKAPVAPEDNYFSPVPDPSPEHWQALLNDLAESQNQWLEFLVNMPDEDLTRTYPDNEMSYYEHIHGLLQHDAYHLGQITLLLKATPR
jgi:uncharacterized damage-inducible protein DinB